MSDPWIPAQQTAPGKVWNPTTHVSGPVAVITISAPAVVGSVPIAGPVVQINITAPAGSYINSQFIGWGVPIGVV